MNKQYIVALIVLGLIAIGGYFYPRTHILAGAPSPAGYVSNVPRILSVTMNLSTAAGTTTSVQNTTGFDIGVATFRAFCQNLGTSYSFPNNTAVGIVSLTIQAATTSVSGLGLQGNGNFLGNLTVATTSPLGTTLVSSTTEPFPNTVSRIIPNGSYLSITSNATSTGSCTIEASGVSL